MTRIAKQLGVGTESLRNWVNQADVDGGGRAGTTSPDARRITELKREVRELRRANNVLKATSPALFAAARPSRRPAGRCWSSLGERRRTAGRWRGDR